MRAKLFNQKRFKEKAEMKKTLNMNKEDSNKHANDTPTDGKFYFDQSIYLSFTHFCFFSQLF